MWVTAYSVSGSRLCVIVSTSGGMCAWYFFLNNKVSFLLLFTVSLSPLKLRSGEPHEGYTTLKAKIEAIWEPDEFFEVTSVGILISAAIASQTPESYPKPSPEGGQGRLFRKKILQGLSYCSC